MILSDLSVKRPTVAIVVSLMLVVFGVVCFTKVPLRQYPDIDPPIVGVMTPYPGASAAIVDTKITRILEEQLNGIEGIKFIDSVSNDGFSRIVIEFDISRDIDGAVNDVQQAVSRTLNQLPQEVDPPRVSKADDNASPIMWFGLVSTSLNGLELSDYASRVLVDRLSIVDGVARVMVGGERKYAMRVYLDVKAMVARGVTSSDIENALRRENIELPAGTLESKTREFSARIDSAYVTPEDFANLVVMRGEDGHLVRLAEVANVHLGAENEDNLFRRNGVPNVGIGVVKQSQANTVAVAKGVKKAVADLRKTLPPGVDIRLNFDESVFIEAAIDEVYKTLAIAVVLVVLVIYLFLGSARTTFVPAITVPISLIAAFIFVYAMGFSINILTLLALVLAIGLVVDDTIVVLENIYRRIEDGEPALLAAYNGARQVGFAVVATTLVLIAVFVPLVFLEGNIGRLFTEFALTMAAAVGFSSFVALTLSPVLCSKILHREDQASPGIMNRVLTAVENQYEQAIRVTARALVPTIGVLVLSLIVIGAILYSIPSEYAPTEDQGFVRISFRGPEGSNFDRTVESMQEIEEIVLKNKEKWEINWAMMRAPGFGSAESKNSGIAVLGLKPWGEREQSSHELVPAISQQMQQVHDGRTFVLNRSFLGGGGFGQPVQVVIGADTYEQLGEIRQILLNNLSDHPILRNVDIDYVESSQQLGLKIDTRRAAELGVDVSTIGRTLETVLGSRKVTTFISEGEEYDVILEGKESDFTSPDDIKEIYVRSSLSDELIPLASVLSIEERGVAPALPRYNRRRALTLSASVAPGYGMGEAIQVVRDIVASDLPATTTIDYKGESLEFVNASGSVIFVFAVALLVAYLVMCAQFESFLHPFVIMLTVPLAIVGALLGLYFTGQTMNIFSQIGLVMLIGLAAKNGILIIEFANQLRDQGVPFEEALFQSARLRLRPILMTSLTTMLGAVPLVIASGAGAEVRFVIGTVIFCGVLSATAMTLFVLPALYLAMSRQGNTPGRVAQKIKQLNEGATQGSSF